MSLVALIAAKRDEHGWSLRELVKRAALCGFTTSRGQWSRWANGQTRPLTVDSIATVAAGIDEDPAVVYTAAGVDLGLAPEWLTSAVAELMAQARLPGGNVVHFAEEPVTDAQIPGAVARAKLAIARAQQAPQPRRRPQGTVPRPTRPSDARDPSAR